MYQTHPSLVLGFHGCDRAVGESLLSGKLPFKNSNKKYDWLGSGMYFWENAPKRALHYAQEKKENPAMGHVEEPFVVGAVIALGRCFNLLDHKNLQILQANYEVFKKKVDAKGLEMPENREPSSGIGRSDLILRFLDRAVIEHTHNDIRDDEFLLEFDSTRAVFVEGDKLYPNAGFNEKNHIQLCIRNPNCIKGFFLPRDGDSNFSLV